MKKMTVVLGSPRDGASQKAAELLMLEASKAGYEIVEYNVNRMDFSGCQACGLCRANGTDCVIADDFMEYVKDLKESELLLLTSPNYYSHIAGPMITFMNRHYCLLDKERKPRLENSLKVAGIFAQGAPAPRKEYEEAYSWYLDIFSKFGMENMGHITIGGDTEEKDLETALSELAKRLL